MPETTNEGGGVLVNGGPDGTGTGGGQYKLYFNDDKTPGNYATREFDVPLGVNPLLTDGILDADVGAGVENYYWGDIDISPDGDIFWLIHHFASDNIIEITGGRKIKKETDINTISIVSSIGGGRWFESNRAYQIW